uniref:Uncharacterized protein n=1 Tax=Trypanosoma vivax (strain Y486) TaxID=1055687 RepID=G0UBR8_TRYVY|nr:hypothetical protein TVY486_1107500 [Trypanosoma vivax Y486]
MWERRGSERFSSSFSPSPSFLSSLYVISLYSLTSFLHVSLIAHSMSLLSNIYSYTLHWSNFTVLGTAQLPPSSSSSFFIRVYVYVRRFICMYIGVAYLWLEDLLLFPSPFSPGAFGTLV